MADQTPPDYDTALGQVRLRVLDNRQLDWDGSGNASYMFSDDEIGAFLAMEDGNVLLAAASVLEAWAMDMLRIMKHIRTNDLSTNGPAVADAMRKQAYQFKQQARDQQKQDMLEFASVFMPMNVRQGTPEELAEWPLPQN